MPNTDWSGVRERVAALSEHPRRSDVFGASGHGFVLLPPLTGAELGDLEAWLGVFLPDDYGSFLTAVAAGGAGPFHGVVPVRATVAGWEWAGADGALTDVSRLLEAFPVERISPHVIDALQAERPREHDFATEEQFDRALDDWDVRLESLLEDPAMTVGAICLADEGCGYRDWLVVSGPARGTMWEDPRCVDEDLKPMLTAEGDPVSFGEWYLTWLAATESAIGEPARA